MVYFNSFSFVFNNDIITGQLLGFLDDNDDLKPSSFDVEPRDMPKEIKMKVDELKRRMNILTDFRSPFK